MPHRDDRTKATASAGKHRTSGRLNVTYRNAAGKTFQAVVVGPGTGSGLLLKLRFPANAFTAGVTTLDNVPAATTPKTNSAYISRNQ